MSDPSQCPAFAPDRFTIARIAAVLGLDVRTVRQALASRECDGQALVGGNVAKTFLVSTLPMPMQTRLAALAKERGYESTERMLHIDEERWQPSVPIARIHPDEVARAQRKAMALAHYCEAWTRSERPASEVQEQARSAFEQTLGYSVTVETVVSVLLTAIRRDGGRGEFDRWQIFLPECPRQVVGRVVKAEGFEQLDACLDSRNAASPTAEDRAWVWTAACDTFKELHGQSVNPRKARRQLLDYLFARAPWMSRSKPSLAKCFDEKWARYLRGELFVADRRPGNSGRESAPALTAEDQNKLIARALHGGVAKAWREAQRVAELSPELTARHISNPASKSYVPTRIRQAITPKVEMLDDIHHGPRRAKLNGAHITSGPVIGSRRTIARFRSTIGKSVRKGSREPFAGSASSWSMSSRDAYWLSHCIAKTITMHV